MLTTCIVYISFVVGFVLQFGVFAYVWRCGLFRSHPAFVVYSGLVPVTNLIDFIFQMTLLFSWHYYFYWVCEFIHIFLGFIVIHEVLASIFEEYEGIRSLGMYLYFVSAIVLIIIGVTAAAATKAHGLNRIFASLERIESALRVVQCGLVLYLIFFMRTLALKWKRSSFGIALGFGVYACLALFYAVAILRLGNNWNVFLDPLLSVGYLLTILIWAAAVMVPARELVPEELPKLKNIEQWNAAILEFLHR